MRSQIKSLLLVVSFLILSLIASVMVLDRQSAEPITVAMQSLINEHQHKMSVIDELLGLEREKASITYLSQSKDAGSLDKLKSVQDQFETKLVEAVSLNLSAENRNKIREVYKLSRALEIELDQAKEQILQNHSEITSNLTSVMSDLKKTGYAQLTEAYEDSQRRMEFAFLLKALAFVLTAIVAFFTVRKLTALERKISREKQRASVTVESMHDAVVTTDDKFNIDYVNEAGLQLFKKPLSELVGQPFTLPFNLFSEHNEHDIRRILIDALDKTHVEMDLFDPLGKPSIAEITVNELMGEDRSGYIVVLRDVTEQRALSKAIEKQARTDALTDLANRSEFEKQLREVIAKQSHTACETSVLCYLDLDNFKVVNDTCGHAAGDELLRQLSKQLKSKLRKNDLLARLGGDEFGVILRDIREEDAVHVAEKLLYTVERFRFCWDAQTFKVGVSIGLVTIGSKGFNEVLSAADQACYSAKDSGRGNVYVYREDDNEIARRKGDMNWSVKLQNAIDNDRFTLHFQFVENFNSPDKIHLEALLRMLDDDNNIIPPMSFIPTAERYNLMESLDKVVVEKVIKMISNYGRSDRDCCVAINVSVLSLINPQFLNFVVNTITDHEIDGNKLCFEISESEAIRNFDNVIEAMKRLKKIGCQFSLDNFGSGFSSFNHLKDLPVNYIKLDGSFMRNIERDGHERKILKSIVDVASAMDIKVIGQFVETQETLDILKTLGVDYAQGYHIHKPAPFGQLTLKD